MQALNAAFSSIACFLDWSVPAESTLSEEQLYLSLIGNLPLNKFPTLLLSSGGLMWLVQACRGLVFNDVKMALWKSLVDLTADSNRSVS